MNWWPPEVGWISVTSSYFGHDAEFINFGDMMMPSIKLSQKRTHRSQYEANLLLPKRCHDKVLRQLAKKTQPRSSKQHDPEPATSSNQTTDVASKEEQFRQWKLKKEKQYRAERKTTKVQQCTTTTNGKEKERRAGNTKEQADAQFEQWCKRKKQEDKKKKREIQALRAQMSLQLERDAEKLKKITIASPRKKQLPEIQLSKPKPKPDWIQASPYAHKHDKSLVTRKNVVRAHRYIEPLAKMTSGSNNRGLRE